jgi:hypothetical protein
MESVDILPQKRLLSLHIISEYTNQFRSSGGTDVAKVAELLLESTAFYDAEMIAELINTMLKHTNNNAINRVTAGEVSNIMNQLRAVGVSIP